MENVIINSENYVVQEPHLHDSILIGIAIEASSVHLRFRTPTMKIVRIVLNDLRGLSLESMFEKNIVFEMRTTPVAKALPQDFQRIFHKSDNVQVSDTRLSELKSENFVFVQIDPTLGADILALCREVTWQFDL
jgi:hypothetical protein